MARTIFRKRLIWGPRRCDRNNHRDYCRRPAHRAESVSDFETVEEAQQPIPASETPAPTTESPELRAVDVVQPRKSDHFVISIEEIATVRPYYRADLRAKLAGDVGFVQKNLNDQVKKGEKLVEIDVPDLVAAVRAKQAVIRAERSAGRFGRKTVGDCRGGRKSRPCRDRPTPSRPAIR